MNNQAARIWFRAGVLFIREGWIEADDGTRQRVSGGELCLRDGWLLFNGDLPPVMGARPMRGLPD
ncbi:MAG: hypothetical protein ACREVJ_12380 [Gammaproteobacteria bacterium]